MEFQSGFHHGYTEFLKSVSSHGALSSEDSAPGVTVTWCSEVLFSDLREPGRKVDSGHGWTDKDNQV